VWKKNPWFLHHILEHTPLLIRDFCLKNDMTVISHPPYSPDLAAPADSYCFLKQKGQRFTTINEIIENLLIEVRKIPRLLSTMEMSLAKMFEPRKRILG